MFPLDAFDDEVQSRFCFPFVKGKQKSRLQNPFAFAGCLLN
jgi:hypothetical protein